MKVAVLVLAAGRVTRMKSRKPKVMHALCGKPMLEWSLDLAQTLSPVPPVVVMGPGQDVMQARYGERARFCLQPIPQGTGDAVIWAREAVPSDTDQLLVLYGDMPLLQAHTLQQLMAAHAAGANATAIVTMMARV